MTARTTRRATTAPPAAVKKATATKRVSPAEVTPVKTTAKAPAVKKAPAAAPVAKAPAKNRVPGRGTTLERLTAPVPTDKAELADHIGTARWAIRRAVRTGNADLQLLAEVRLAQLLRVKEERAAKATKAAVAKAPAAE